MVKRCDKDQAGYEQSKSTGFCEHGDKHFVVLQISCLKSSLKMLVPTAASYGVLTYHTGSWVRDTQIGNCIQHGDTGTIVHQQ